VIEALTDGLSLAAWGTLTLPCA